LSVVVHRAIVQTCCCMCIHTQHPPVPTESNERVTRE
jgi:hypothetical protein